jgi:hypothetical protein
MQLSSHIRVFEGKPNSSRTLKSARMCCHDVWTDATLNCSASWHWWASERMTRPSERNLGIRLFWVGICIESSLNILKHFSEMKTLKYTTSLIMTTTLHASDFVNKILPTKLTQVKFFFWFWDTCLVRIHRNSWCVDLVLIDVCN